MSDSDGGIKSSDFDASLPDNEAEIAAAKDAAEESAGEKSYRDAHAEESANALRESIFSKEKEEE